MEMISERSNKGKEKLIEDDDHCPSQNNLPGSDNQQQNFGWVRGATEAAVSTAADGASFSHSASEKKRTKLLPVSDFIDQVDPHRLRWTEKLHNVFVRAMEELVRRGKKVTPKTLTKAMAIDGITQQHVKSRLQAFRQRRITETNWQAPRGPRRKNNNAGIIDGQKSASSSASTSTQEHEQNGPGMEDQNGVGLQIQTAGFQDHNGVFYPLQPGNDNPWVQHAQVGVGLQEQTPDFQDQNGLFYPFQPGNDNPWVQHAQVGVGLQEQTPDFQDQNEVNNFEPGNELACVVQQEYELAQVVQQPARDGEALGNIQQQNQPQAATDTVQAQNATAITQDNMEDPDDYFNYESYCSGPFGIAGQTL